MQPILGYASTVKLALADPPTKVDKPKTSADEMADHMELVQLNGPSEDTTSARKARASTAEKSVKLDESAAEGDGTERSISNEASTDDEAMKDRTEPQSEKTSELCAADWAEELAPATPFNWYRTIIVAEQPAGQRIWSVEHLPIARFNAFNVKGLVVSGFLRDADKIQDIAMPVCIHHCGCPT